jgi:hypothetical protein
VAPQYLRMTRQDILESGPVRTVEKPNYRSHHLEQHSADQSAPRMLRTRLATELWGHPTRSSPSCAPTHPPSRPFLSSQTPAVILPTPRFSNDATAEPESHSASAPFRTRPATPDFAAPVTISCLDIPRPCSSPERPERVPLIVSHRSGLFTCRCLHV